MLDYLKRVNSIFLVLLFSFTCCASIQNVEREDPLLDDHIKVTMNEIANFLSENDWDFNNSEFNKEITGIEKIIKESGIKEDEYNIIIAEFIASVNYQNFLVISVNVVIQGVHNKWVGDWMLVEGEPYLYEEIKKEDNKS